MRSFPGLSAGMLLLGVDFSSAPTARKPITAAIGHWRRSGRTAWYDLEDIRELPSLDAFTAFLQTPGPWIGGFDLPFGQPRPLIEHEDWPTRWPEFVRFFCGQPRDVLRERFRAWCGARPPGDKFAWRRADKPAGSSPAMRWTNPPVAWMMHAGIERMLAAGLSFPAHRHAPRGARAAQSRIAVEAYPGFTARQVCRRSYKSDAPGGRTQERADNRRAIVAALTAGAAGLAIRLTMGRGWTKRLVAEPRGDLLDAVICALQAGHAAALPNYGLPRAVDPLEGWIASVP
jgi:hypothetical protein